MLTAAAILLVVYFFVAAVRITSAVGKEAAIFREFGQSKKFRVLVWLFPVGPILLLVGPFFVGFLVAFVLSAVCYVPALVAARKCLASFERAGTDRVKRAQNTATQAFGNAIAGLVFSAFIFVINLGAWIYAPTN